MHTNYKKNLLFTIYFLCYGLLTAAPVYKTLNDGWKFKQAGTDKWYPASVPGVVHTDLLNNQLIKDPFFRLNERELQWIDKGDWIYETTFPISPETLQKDNIRLHFKGLDTYADVYLNGQQILSANNMFREWFADIKTLLKPSDNTLTVYFHSPVKIDVPKWEALPFQYEAGNDQSETGGLGEKKISIFARKAGYHYGWDWGPRLVTSGIWRPITLEAWNNARIENIQVIQKSVSKDSAVIVTVAEILSDKVFPNTKINITDGNSGENFGAVSVKLEKGLNKIEIPLTIYNPELWWCNGLGKPHLYDFKTELILDNTISDSKTEKIGIRSLKLINEPDKDGKTFYFELNGIPVFAKGANYIPNDSFLPRVSREKYEKTILDAVNVNMNMLRIWGGGIYEDDYFYELCDKYGIMVWQDFMFACSLYPAEGELLENIRQEAIDNVRRLRNHPCIALWCGNNECNDGWYGWGWKKKYERMNPEYAQRIWQQFTDQYHVVLPEVVQEHMPGCDYRPSSPFARADGPSDDHSGDRHYWEVWHGKVPITNYNLEKSRFFSEYGFQAFPEFASVKQYAPEEEDWSINSEVMMSHQRGGKHANNLINTYLENEYHKPKNFESFLYMNHILQGDAIKTAIEAHRRAMPYCMGTLFWQHNDCWPVASWSSRDYYGRWKAQHYFCRQAFRDILISPITENGVLNVYGISDRLGNTKGSLKIEVIDFNGKVINRKIQSVNLPANSSHILFTAKPEELLKGKSEKDVVIRTEFTDNKRNSYCNNYFLVKQKEINYPITEISHSIKTVKGGYEVTLSTDKFARGVFMSLQGIDNTFEDNYFDLLPGKKTRVYVQCDLSLEEFEKQLKITSLSGAY